VETLKNSLVALVISVGIFSVIFASTAMANTEKDATVRLNLMNLDCTIDQVFAGNEPSYIVTPAGCNIPPVTDVIPTTETPSDPVVEAPLSDTSRQPATLPEPEAEAFFPTPYDISTPSSATNSGEAGPSIVAPLPNDERPISAVATVATIGASAAVSLIVVDAFIFNSQLVNGAVSMGRRLVQLILKIIVR